MPEALARVLRENRGSEKVNYRIIIRKIRISRKLNIRLYETIIKTEHLNQVGKLFFTWTLFLGLCRTASLIAETCIGSTESSVIRLFFPYDGLS
jgi:hypothetical protein